MKPFSPLKPFLNYERLEEWLRLQPNGRVLKPTEVHPLLRYLRESTTIRDINGLVFLPFLVSEGPGKRWELRADHLPRVILEWCMRLDDTPLTVTAGEAHRMLTASREEVRPLSLIIENFRRRIYVAYRETDPDFDANPGA
jgi:hypothetical protein